MNPSFVEQFEERGLKFVGTDVDGQRMEIIELQGSICYSVSDSNLFVYHILENPREGTI